MFRITMCACLLLSGCADRETCFSPDFGQENSIRLISMLEQGETDALEVIHDGNLVASIGAVRVKTNVASVRKSLISGLIGIAIEKGLIDPGSTLEELGIDERSTPLSPMEASATVLDLLKARSGVYLPSIGESGGMIERRPARGSSAPGEVFYYNNWDFNVLGSIFENETGLDLGVAFNEWIAAPLGMQDFQPGDVRYQEAAYTDHRMYRFYMSARDLARFGSLYVNEGRWQDVQIIPSYWIGQTLTKYSGVPYSSYVDGYGYLWWIDSEGGRYWAEGSGGQYLMIDRVNKLVMVTLNDRDLKLFNFRLHNPMVAAATFEEVDGLWNQVSEAVSQRGGAAATR